MYCAAKLFLILCTITLIKAIGLKIDGLLNLGDSWSYEYRIQRSNAKESPHLRTEESAQDKNDAVARQRDEETTTQTDFQAIFEKEREIAYERDKETARNIDKIIAQQRDAEVAHHIDKIARQNVDKNEAQIQDEMDHLLLAEKVIRQEAKRLRLEAENFKKDQRQGPINDYKLHYIHNTNILKTAATDSPSSDESNKRDGPKTETVIMDFDTNKKSKKMLRHTRNYSNTHSSESREPEPRHSSETSASFDDKEKARQGVDRLDADASTFNHNSPENIIKIDKQKTKKPAKRPKQKDIFNELTQDKNNTEDLKTYTNVTTVRTGNIFTDVHQVKDDTKILEFTNHLYKQTLKIFHNIKEKTNQGDLKEQIGSLSESYQDKFKEFIKDTNGQNIKTRLGTQKVILNSIDTSFRLLNRLLNFMINSLDNKGTLRHNAGTVNRFQKAIEIEKKLQLIRACKKFTICRIGPGFSAFLVDIMDILLKCDDTKFKKSMDAFTEVVKNLQFDDLLEPDVEKILKVVIARMERENVVLLRAMVMVLKNTIASQNKPLIVNNYAARSNVVNSTLALLEIIDLLDTQIPRIESNHLEWADMKKSMEEFATGKRQDIQDIMEAFFRHLIKNLKVLDATSKKIISRNLAMILSLVVG